MCTNVIKNLEGIAVPVVSEDKEQEVSKWPEILKHFDLTFKKKENTFTARLKECFCKFCIQLKFDKCENLKIAELPQQNTFKVLGDREPKGRETIKNDIDEAVEDEEFVVEKVIATRKFKAKQFKIN
jgi:hypothetical protein